MFAETAAPASATARLAAVLIGVVVGILVIIWVDITAPSVAPYRVTEMLMADLTSLDYNQVKSVQFKAKSKPFQHVGRLGIARLTINVDDPEAARLALFIGRARDNFEVYVNGKLARGAEGTFGTRPTLHGFHPTLIPILPALLTSGDNNIDVMSSRNAVRSVLRDVYFGPLEKLEPFSRHYEAVTTSNAELAAYLAGVVLVFALALSSVIRNQALMITIAVTLALFLARELHTLWINYPWPQMWRDVYLNFFAAALWLSCAAFINEWTNGPNILRRWLLIAVAIIAIIDLSAYAIVTCHEAYWVGSLMQSICGIVALAFMTYRAVRHYASAPASALGEISLLALGLMMALATIFSQSLAIPIRPDFLVNLGEGFNQIGAMALIMLIAVGLSRQGLSIYALAAMNNEALSQRIAIKERELQKQHEILRAQESERTLVVERGRIMSDVHDGIGSQLLGLLIQARAPDTKKEVLIEGLQSALDDLYLVVDSLDTTEGSLQTALGTFRARIKPKCEAAGIGLDWNVSSATNTKSLAPTAVLQICRVLQEAVSNAIRHGKASRLRLTCLVKEDAVDISLTDNGSGFDTSLPHAFGKGLANMKKRAASIGASFNIQSKPQETTVHLHLNT